MEVIGVLKLSEFWKQHKRAKKPLERWQMVAEKANWKNFAQVKQTFNDADWIKTFHRSFVVFDIGGNKYRLITAINFKGQVVVIDVVLTHTEYDKGKWKDLL